MKTVKITVTDENDIVLDSTTLEVNDDMNRVAFRGITVGNTTRVDEDTLIIGLPPR